MSDPRALVDLRLERREGVLMTVQLEDLCVLYATAHGGVPGAAAAMHRVEEALPTLRGRKFYGVCYDPESDYRACVVARDDDDVAALALTQGVIPGGVYARAKISAVDDIAATFQAMRAEHVWDPERPSIEFYRSAGEILLYWPIAQP